MYRVLIQRLRTTFRGHTQITNILTLHYLHGRVQRTHTGLHCAQDPPMHASTVAAGKPPQSGGSNIHDPISELKEQLPLQWLREEVSLVVQRVNIWHNNLPVLDTLAHEEMARYKLNRAKSARPAPHEVATAAAGKKRRAKISKLEAARAGKKQKKERERASDRRSKHSKALSRFHEDGSCGGKRRRMH